MEVSGDTRFDRVIEIAVQPKIYADIEKFIANSKVIVAGSTWTEDDEELDHFANTNPEIKFIIAPHNIEKERLDECLRLYKNSILYSKLTNTTIDKNVLIIDNVGMLSSLYNYSTIAYIGGGFGGDGVHNVLEAAVYGKPVIFGPEYEKFIEANDLIASNGAISIENALELEQVLQSLFNDKTELNNVGDNAANYVAQKSGATRKIINYINKNRLLTN
jgi:3-deoxy-D-manno-octulosonic-acid transferase